MPVAQGAVTFTISDPTSIGQGVVVFTIEQPAPAALGQGVTTFTIEQPGASVLGQGSVVFAIDQPGQPVPGQPDQVVAWRITAEGRVPLGVTLQPGTQPGQQLAQGHVEFAIEQPAAPKGRTLIGSATWPGTGMSADAVQQAVNRWGPGTAIRVFSASGWTPGPPKGNAGVVLLSWKPDLTRSITEAECLTALANVSSGSKVCVWHEPDVKVRQGHYPNADQMKARAAEFAAIVREHRPDLVLYAVLSGFTFNPSTNFNASDYIDPASFDVLGVDYDGGSGGRNYVSYLPKMWAWMESVGISRWNVPEFGNELTETWGPTQRTQWLSQQVNGFLSFHHPPEEICLFESMTYPSYILNTEAERSMWSALIASTNGA